MSDALEIVPRSAWLAGGPAPRRAPTFGRVECAVVHHTAMAGGITAVHALHQIERGWDDIGYNLLVDGAGRVYEGRAGGVERAVVGAHALGWNRRSTGIALLGDHSAEPATPAALDALFTLLDWKLGLHGLTAGAETVCLHGDLAATACPGAALRDQIRTRLRERD
jgi:hypothetical protein